MSGWLIIYVFTRTVRLIHRSETNNNTDISWISSSLSPSDSESASLPRYLYLSSTQSSRFSAPWARVCLGWTCSRSKTSVPGLYSRHLSRCPRPHLHPHRSPQVPAWPKRRGKGSRANAHADTVSQSYFQDYVDLPQLSPSNRNDMECRVTQVTVASDTISR